MRDGDGRFERRGVERLDREELGVGIVVDAFERNVSAFGDVVGRLLVGGDDALAQSEQIFRNIERLLGKAGASLDDVALLRCFLTDAKHFEGYSAVKRRYFSSDPPAGTTVIVAGLLDPRLLLEVEVVAVVSAS